MTPEAQRIAIAEACGWKLRPAIVGSCWQHPTEPLRNGHLPDYLNDLNAMHEAEKTLTPELLRNYAAVRLPVACGAADWHEQKTICATASQRAEAFLRTKGLWK